MVTIVIILGPNYSLGFMIICVWSVDYFSRVEIVNILTKNEIKDEYEIVKNIVVNYNWSLKYGVGS